MSAILWSDILFFILLVSAFIIAVRSRQHWNVRAAWNQVMQQPLAVMASVILMIFMFIAMLDSIHFLKGSTEFSVLDQVLSPLGQDYEKTYSAPFARHLFSHEITLNDAGVAKAFYPPLEFAALHVSSTHELLIDVGYLAIKGVIFGILTTIIWMLITLTGASWLQGRNCFDSPIKKSNWRLWYLTWLVSFVILAILFQWSRYYHVFGTDQVGQDILYLTLKSIRTGVFIGTITTLVMLPFALLLGISSGYFGGIVDDVIQYIYTTLSSIPSVLLIVAAILSMQVFIANHPDKFVTLGQTADARLLALCFILGVTSWTSLCRLLRAETLKLREMDFIRAAKVLGTGHWRILTKHILPNAMHIVLITVVLDFSTLVLAEAVLSYVGVGVAPTTISWGNMINSARLELAREPTVWWPIGAAFIFMFLLVLSANVFADAVRDAFDPRA